MLQTTVENYSGCFCMFIKAYILSIPLFAILVIIPVDCYYFWWEEWVYIVPS